MRHALLSLLCLVVFLAPSCGSGGGSGLPPGTKLDQYTTNTPGSRLVPFGREVIGGRVLQLGQTFTVGLTGRLVAVDFIAGGADSDLIVRIMPAPGGVIDEDPSHALEVIRILAVDVQPPGYGMFVRLSGGGLAVTAGDELAITFEHPDGVGRCMESAVRYDRGAAFERDNQNLTMWSPPASNADLVFGTYVAP